MEFINYLYKPIIIEYTKPKIQIFIKLFFIYYASAFSLSIFLGLLIKVSNITNLINEIPEKKLFILSILAPVYEEIIFRSLLKFNKTNLILFTSTISILISLLFYRSDIKLGIMFFTILIIFILILIIFKTSTIQKTYNNHFNYIFYSSILLFGFMHISNFSGSTMLIVLFSPLLVSPQLILGAILGYIRMKNGLAYSILFHLLINFITIIIFR